MYSEFADKRILVLGGVKRMIDAVKTAQSMGIQVYVTDYLEDSPCKKIANKSFMVSATDVDAVVDLIKQEKIDGVITGFVDSLLPSYVEICQKAGLPCYANSENLEIILNKKKIKEACMRHGIPVPHSYSQDEIANDKVTFPVIVKPVDGSGSRGCTVCENKEQIYSAIEYALSYSKVGDYLVEEYIKGETVLQLFFMQDGELITMCLGDVQTIQYYDDKPKIGICHLQPSTHTKWFLSELYPKYCALFDALHMKNGPIEIDSYERDGIIYWGDIGFRLTGDLTYNLANEAFDVNFFTLLIEYALTGKCSNEKIADKCDPFLFGKYASQIKFAIRPGIIDKIIGEEEIKKIDGVFFSDIFVKEGFELKEEDRGKLVQVVGRVHIMSDSIEKLEDSMYRVFSGIDFLDKDGNSLKIDLSQYHSCINVYKKSIENTNE